MQVFKDWTPKNTVLGVAKYPAVPVKRIAARVQVSGLAGDKFIITAQAELTNDLGFNVGIGRDLIRIKKVDDNSRLATTGTQLKHDVMTNLTPDIHHLVIDTAAIDTLPSDGDFFYSLIVWGVATAGSGNVAIEENFCGIEAINLGQ